MNEKNINTEETVAEEAAEAVKETEQTAECAECKALGEKLAKAEAEITAEKDKYLRLLAEYDNFRKRSVKEREASYADAYGDALSAILPVIDNLERALAFSEGDTLTEGVRMTLKQFEDALARLGVEAFGARGEAFDPHFHNAIMREDNPDLPENTVSEVFQRGYKKGDRILRDAMVKVAN